MVDENSKAYHAVLEIVEDIRDRQGIGNEFEQADSDIQDEMMETWKKIIIKWFSN